MMGLIYVQWPMRPPTPSLPHSVGRGPILSATSAEFDHFAPPSLLVGEGWGGGAPHAHFCQTGRATC